MLSSQQSLSLSPYMALYDAIVPKTHFLRQMKDMIDFSFIEEELQDKYCLDNGRIAEPPVRMFKYVLLKQIYDLSDLDLVERAAVDMSFKYFLDLTPEASVIHSSSLTKFRRLRLHDKDLMALLVQKTVELAIENNVLTSKTVIVDATHTSSRFHSKRPVAYLKEKSKSLRKAVYQQEEAIKDRLPAQPSENDLEEEVTYTKQLLETIEKEPRVSQTPAVKEQINRMREIVDDIDEEKSYSEDPEARTGYKAQDQSFFGYKTHLALSDERIITAAVVTTGEKNDSNYLMDLIEETKQNGMEVDAVVGDKAYSGKKIIQYAEANDIQLAAKLHPVISYGRRADDDYFEFNKDADMYVCPAGHLAYRKKLEKRYSTTQNPQMKYFFDVKKCKVCPLREGCYKEGADTKSYSVTIKSDQHLEQEAFQETETFKHLSKKRYKVEAKNAELKQRHGYGQASSSGLFGMKIEGAASLFTANIKRIIKLMNEKEQ
ncbi:IS1182 family transposase [Salisediminibacterium halotolerans]|uniref:Transposase domain n=1 Tax=Salisediminibacterium halotolerans TaxID=517425 RepID=A0A1H9WYW4_9BACI|nr:IS1182 family transposase [Salisediminibacterium haloalkalitolerans]SES39096.1 Transposase domain [Salisediminibacterium haloalkalitolerans]